MSGARPTAVLLVGTLAVSTLVNAAVTVYALRQSPDPGRRPFAGMMAAMTVWTGTYGVSLLVHDRGARLLWEYLQWFGIAPLPVFFFLFAVTYTGYDDLLTRPRLAALGAVPALTVGVVWTNPLHGLMWELNRVAVVGGVATTIQRFGPWFEVNFWFGYLLIGLGSVLLLRLAFVSDYLYLDQSVLIVAAIAVGVAGNVVAVTGRAPVPGLDLTPYAFTVSGLALGYALFRRRLLGLAPATRRIGRQSAVADLDDGVVILDDDRRVVYCNDAAADTFGVDRRAVLGDPVDRLVGVADVDFDAPDSLGTVAVADRTYEVRASPVTDRDGRGIGHTLVFTDVTGRVERERQLRRQRDELRHVERLNRVLREVTAALVDASGREDVESAVCERLADSGLYDAAWVGDRAGEDWTGRRAVTDGGTVAEVVELDAPPALAGRAGDVPGPGPAVGDATGAEGGDGAEDAGAAVGHPGGDGDAEAPGPDRGDPGGGRRDGDGEGTPHRGGGGTGEDHGPATDGPAAGGPPAVTPDRTGGPRPDAGPDGGLADDPDAAGSGDGGDAGWVTVPLSYGRTVYGMLVLRTDRPDVGDRERATLEELGRAVGHALNAAEHRRLLAAGATVELEFECADPGSALVTAARECDCEPTVAGVVPGGSETVAYLDAGDAAASAVADAVADVEGVVDATPVAGDDGRGDGDDGRGDGGDGDAGEGDGEAGGDGADGDRESGRGASVREADPGAGDAAAAGGGDAVELRLTGGSVVVPLLAAGANVRSVGVEDEAVRAVVEVAPGADVRRVTERVRSELPETELLARRELDRPAAVGDDDAFDGVVEDLTDRQREVLEAAYRAGYFDWPRESSAEDVADTLGIASSTLHGHLRKGERRLLDAFFEDDPDGERIHDDG